MRTHEAGDTGEPGLQTLERVLHVEDDPSIRMVTSVTLTKVGKLQVLSCESGPEALEKAPGFAPQLVLLDVMMPGMDGPATLEALRKSMDLDGVLVLFMTAKVQQNELEYYHSLGARDVIMKPFDPMTLTDQIREQWQAWQEERGQSA